MQRHWFLVNVLSVSLVTVFATGSTYAQLPRYRIIAIMDLGDHRPGVTTARDQHGTIAINNWGQVVHTRKDGLDFRAWVYLPEPAFGQSKGPQDLPTPMRLDSAAWDINQYGEIVGQYGEIDGQIGATRGSGYAMRWKLGANIRTCQLRIQGLAPGGWSVAYAVNDAGVIVGDAEIATFDDGCVGIEEKGFRYDYNGCNIMFQSVDTRCPLQHLHDATRGGV